MSRACGHHRRQFRSSSARGIARLTCVRMAVFAAVVCAAGLFVDNLANAQLGRLGSGRSRLRFGERPTVFTGATRQLLRPLRLAETAISDGDYEQACMLLGAMLEDDQLKDCLVPDDREWGYAVSLRQKAFELLGSLNAQQRLSYQKKYATRARQLLDKAIEARNYPNIEYVSERYLYTDSGLEATMLLGHHWLNRGRAEASMAAFEKLLAIPRATQLYDPELRLLAAIAFALSRQETKAVEQLAILKETAREKLSFFKSKVPIYADDEDPLEWLTALVGDSPLTQNKSVTRWLLWQGNPQRNAETSPGLPLYSPRWSTGTLGQYESAQRLENWMDVMARNQVAPVPKTHLLTVGDTIVTRTAGKMLGIDVVTGKRQWSFPADDRVLAGDYLGDSDNAGETASQIVDGNDLVPGIPLPLVQTRRQKKFYERVIQDSVFSQIASDGKMIFCVLNPGLATNETQWDKYSRNRFESPTDLKKYNDLCGVNVAAQGAVAWQVGGLDGGDETRLAQTFFLGCPLPLNGDLYCICVQDKLVKLVVLDSENGSLQWEKELASTEDTVDFSHDAVRRLAGATPSESEGMLVCPTGLNAIVAVDIATRSLKWGLQISSPEVIRWNQGNDKKGKFWEAYENLWRDTTLKISDGVVVYTPVGSKELYCIDLKSGRSRWRKSRYELKGVRRADALCAVAVRDGQVILVAAGRLRGVDLAKGKVAWEIPFDSLGTASGLGYLHGDSYCLPTTSKKLVQFDLVSKSISKVVDTQRVLGNLFPWKSDILSVGVDHVAAFPCDVTSERITELADSGAAPVDWVDWKPHTRLAIKAQLQLQQGNYPEAARLIGEAYDLFPNSSYASVLVEVLMELIRVDFRQAEVIFQRYQSLFGPHDLQRLLRRKVNGLVRSQRYQEACATLLEIAGQLELPDLGQLEPGGSVPYNDVIKLVASEIDLSPAMASAGTNGVVEISRAAWLRWQLSMLTKRIYAKSSLKVANQPNPDRLAAMVEAHLNKFRKESAHQLFRRLQLFPRTLLPPALVIDTAERLLNEQYRGEALSLLMVPESTDRSHSARGQWPLKVVEAGFEDSVDPSISLRRMELIFKLALSLQDFKAAKLIIGMIEKKTGDTAAKMLAQYYPQIEILQNELGKHRYSDDLYLRLARDGGTIRGPRYDLEQVHWQRSVSRIGDGERVPFREGRHHCVVFESDLKEFRRLNFSYEASRGELQMRDPLGRKVRSVYLAPNGNRESFAAGTTGKIFLKNSVMLFCMGKEMFALDWIRMVRGEDPLLWSIRLKQGTSARNVFGGPRHDGVCYLDGSEMKCVDLFTGQTKWVRNRIPYPSMVKEGGDRITIWNDSQRIYETFDKHSGRRIAGGTISSQCGATAIGHNHLHLFQTPIQSRKSEPSSEGPGKSLPNAKFADLPYSQLKLQMFNFHTGDFDWERTCPFPTVFSQLDEDRIAILSRTGVLSVLNIETGQPLFEQQVKGLKDIHVSKLEVMPMGNRLVCRVSTTETCQPKVELDDVTEVHFFNIRSSGWLRTGYVFAVDDQTGESLWSAPTPVELFGFLRNTPCNSPFLLALRRANYRTKGNAARNNKGTKPRVQLAMIDVDTGHLKYNHLFNLMVNNEPYCQLVCRPGSETPDKPGQDQLDQQRSDGQGAEDGTVEVEGEGEGEGNEAAEGAQRLELTLGRRQFSIYLADANQADANQAGGQEQPAVLTNEATAMRIEDAPQRLANKDEGKLVVDLTAVARRAREAYKAMLEQQKLEARLFEEERRARLAQEQK